MDHMHDSVTTAMSMLMNSTMGMVMNMTNTTGHHMHPTTMQMDHSNMNHPDMSHTTGHNMYMHFGNKELVVFYGWKTDNDLTFVFTCIGIFFISMLFEFIKFLRVYMVKKGFFNRIKNYRRSKSMSDSYDIKSADSSEESSPKKSKTKKTYIKSILNLEHLVQTFFYFVQMTVAYFLMLVFMIFNWWLCISILLGLTVGYFFFGFDRSHLDVNDDDCH